MDDADIASDVTVHWDVLLLVLFSAVAAKLLHRVSGRGSQWVREFEGHLLFYKCVMV